MVRLSPSRYRRITLAATVALCAIVVTGAAVRLTGSGLGCNDWPNCYDDGRLVAEAEQHALTEFINRMITGLVSLAVIAAVAGALVRVPRRRDLTWLALSLVAGVIAQILLGALVVLWHLTPWIVGAHFLVSMVLVASAVVLHWRAAREHPQLRWRRGPLGLHALGVVALAALVLVLGTVVTGTGPHSGEHDGDVARYGFTITSVARVHSGAVWCLLAATVWLWWRARSMPGSGPVRGAAELALWAMGIQGTIGYVQYAAHLPWGLVLVHIAGSLAVWIAVLHLALVAGAPAVDADAGERAGELAGTTA